jgi:hypothetical protein
MCGSQEERGTTRAPGSIACDGYLGLELFVGWGQLLPTGIHTGKVEPFTRSSLSSQQSSTE